MKVSFSDIQGKALGTLGEDRKSSLTILVCRIVCVGFALIETWSQLRFINEDGISYLDMSDALVKHNWHLLVNPIWSPLYPFLIGLVTWLTRPPAQWEVPLVHALNFVIFVGALASFEFLLRQAITVLRPHNGRADAVSGGSLPVWTWQLLGYSLFAWSTIGMIWAPRYLTPDLLVAMFVYLDVGLLLRLRSSTHKSRICLLLGLTLGLGYLAKAILYPMAFVFMVVAFFMIGEWRKAARSVAMTFLLFCVVSAPLVIAMSRRVGHPSFSESGSLNYVWHIDRFNPYSAATSGPPSYLKHPMTILHRSPDVFGFREDVLPVTYPPRTDMAYWSAGAHPVINLRTEFRTIGENLIVLFRDGHILPLSGLIVVAVLFVLISPDAPRRFKSILSSWPLLVSGVAALSSYLLMWVEPRYVAPFLVIVLLGLFPGVLFRNPQDAATRTELSMVAVATSLIVLSALLVFYHLAGFPRSVPPGRLWVQVSQSLNRAGVQPGEDVAIIGDGSDGCRWARLARVRIVAQIRRKDASDFWRASSPHVKTAVYDAFARAGAKAVVAEETPPSGESADWQRLGNTHYYVRLLAVSGRN